MSLGNRIIILTLILFMLPCCGGGGGGGGSSGEGSTVTADTSGAIRLAWDASPDSSVAGYRVYYGRNSGIYQNHVDTGPVTGAEVNFTLTGLDKGQTYYIVVSAYNQHEDESDFSNEVGGVAR
jgi:hypothetical protein